jgi:predicted component of type VI protein secretion system
LGFSTLKERSEERFLGRASGHGQERFEHRIRVERHTLNALLNQELGKCWVVARRLTAEANLASFGLRDLDDLRHHHFDCWVAFVKEVRHNRGVAIDAQHELRQVV